MEEGWCSRRIEEWAVQLESEKEEGRGSARDEPGERTTEREQTRLVSACRLKGAEGEEMYAGSCRISWEEETSSGKEKGGGEGGPRNDGYRLEPLRFFRPSLLLLLPVEKSTAKYVLWVVYKGVDLPLQSLRVEGERERAAGRLPGRNPSIEGRNRSCSLLSLPSLLPCKSSLPF